VAYTVHPVQAVAWSWIVAGSSADLALTATGVAHRRRATGKDDALSGTLYSVKGDEDASEGRQPAHASEQDKSSPVSGISEFLGRVFEQLSLASWLPATMLVGNAVLLLQLHSNESLDVVAAVKDLTKGGFGLLVVLLFALILASIVTQAFELELIRALEGYFDWSRGPLPKLVKYRIRRHTRKLASLEDRGNEAR
jgi:hypothetical protein